MTVSFIYIILWTADPFWTKLSLMVHHPKLDCHVKNCFTMLMVKVTVNVQLFTECVSKLGMMMHHHEPECLTKRLSGLSLMSILRSSLGLPVTTFRAFLGSFKGSNLIWNSSCAKVFCFVYDALCPFCNSVLGSVWSDSVTFTSFSCTLSGMLAHLAVTGLFKGLLV